MVRGPFLFPNSDICWLVTVNDYVVLPKIYKSESTLIAIERQKK